MNCPYKTSLHPGCIDRQTTVCLGPLVLHQKDDGGCPSEEGALTRTTPLYRRWRNLECSLGVNQYNHQKGVKRDTNLMSHPDSPLLDNPYGSTAALEEESLERPGEWQPSLELDTPVQNQGRGW